MKKIIFIIVCLWFALTGSASGISPDNGSRPSPGMAGISDTHTCPSAVDSSF